MRFCHQCRHPLSLGVEKYCPNCGANLVPVPSGATTSSSGGKDYSSSTNIGGTSGDVFGAGFSGSGNIVGKEVGYTVHGSVINLHVDSLSAEILGDFKRFISASTQIDRSTASDNNVNKAEKIREATTNKQQISQVLEEVNRIGKEKGIEIKEIRAGEIQTSSKELALKEILHKGKEHYYKGEYSEALQAFDRVIEIDPNHSNAWYGKGIALNSLRKYNEAIEAYDKAIQVDPNYADAWYGKGIALDILGKDKDAEKCYDKVTELNQKSKASKDL